MLDTYALESTLCVNYPPTNLATPAIPNVRLPAHKHLSIRYAGASLFASTGASAALEELDTRRFPGHKVPRCVVVVPHIARQQDLQGSKLRRGGAGSVVLLSPSTCSAQLWRRRSPYDMPWLWQPPHAQHPLLPCLAPTRPKPASPKQGSFPIPTTNPTCCACSTLSHS